MLDCVGWYWFCHFVQRIEDWWRYSRYGVLVLRGNRTIGVNLSPASWPVLGNRTINNPTNPSRTLKFDRDYYFEEDPHNRLLNLDLDGKR